MLMPVGSIKRLHWGFLLKTECSCTAPRVLTSSASSPSKSMLDRKSARGQTSKMLHDVVEGLYKLARCCHRLLTAVSSRKRSSILWIAQGLQGSYPDMPSRKTRKPFGRRPERRHHMTRGLLPYLEPIPGNPRQGCVAGVCLELLPAQSRTLSISFPAHASPRSSWSSRLPLLMKQPAWQCNWYIPQSTQ